MAPDVLGANSRRLAAFATACSLFAVLIFFVVLRLSSHLAVQVPVVILNVILVVAAFMFALNSAHTRRFAQCLPVSSAR
jgi:ABC-type xylose transport system permease subunit